jgi:GNAT superfamily N-acetyltransferase
MIYAIRRCRDNDILAIMTLFYETIHTVNTRDYSPEQISAWAPVSPDRMDHAGWAGDLAAKYTVVAEGEDGTLLGFANLEAMEGLEHSGHIDRFFGHKDYQGIGVGSALLAALEGEARRRGMTRLFTEASITAHPFFERRGFRTRAEQTVERFGIALVNYRMEKRLG